MPSSTPPTPASAPPATAGHETGTPRVGEVERVCAVADPVLRNLQITQCYHELSAALARRLPGSANWCTFATWASKQAGQTIRGEDLRRAAERLAGLPTEGSAVIEALELVRQVGGRRDLAAVRAALAQVADPRAAFERASDAVARGNLKVFQEIGLAFARYLTAIPAEGSHDPERIERFCAELRPGEPPEGQALLRQAFRRYYQAAFETDTRARAELLLMANLEVGLHEQTRLQPEIAEALDAPAGDPTEVKRRLREALAPGWFGRLRLRLLRLWPGPDPLEVAAERALALARRRARLAITDSLMTLDLAGELLRLGRDLHGAFPVSLHELRNAELTALLARIDPTPGSLAGSGARDWSTLSERMHFIADLFRAYQERPQLLQPPFSAEQVAALRAGRRPAGRL